MTITDIDCTELSLLGNYVRLQKNLGLRCTSSDEDIVYLADDGTEYRTPRDPKFVRYAVEMLNSVKGEGETFDLELVLVWMALCLPESLSSQNDFLTLRKKLGLECRGSDQYYVYYWLKTYQKGYPISIKGKTGLHRAHHVLKVLNDLNLWLENL